MRTRFRFDAFELDSAAGELRKSGRLRSLQPQPFRVLKLLMEHAGQLVSREEIRRCLWEESTFVDFEHGINFSINQIRAALGDSAERPRYVETLPRRGYRFVGALELEPNPSQTGTATSDDAIADIPSGQTASGQGKRTARLALFVCAAFLVVSLMLAALWTSRRWASRHAVATNGRRAVAVIEIANHSHDPSLDWLGDGVADLLTTDLAQARGLDVISSERIRSLMARELKPGQSLPASQAQGVARRAGADVFVSGGILNMGQGFRLDLRVQDAGSGRVLLSEKVEGNSPQAIFSMVDETTDRIVSRLSPGDAVRHGTDKLTCNFGALHAYEEGISYQNRYLIGQAVASFRRASEFDPQFAMAYYQLAGLLPSYSEKHEALTRAALAAERQGLPEHQRLLIRATQLRFDGRF
jgi:DNA-binding winged helix-turn-helix (wHTH) protein/TolB-like protein